MRQEWAELSLLEFKAFKCQPQNSLTTSRALAKAAPGGSRSAAAIFLETSFKIAAQPLVFFNHRPIPILLVDLCLSKAFSQCIVIRAKG